MDQFPEPEFDASLLSAIRLQQLGNVTLEEITYAYKSTRSKVYDIPEMPKAFGYHFCIGFSFKSRCFLIALDYKNGKYRFLDVKLANENEIEEFWCGGQK